MITNGTWCYYNDRLVVVIVDDGPHLTVIGCTDADHWERVDRDDLISEDDAVKDAVNDLSLSATVGQALRLIMM